jgi:hypothetical protein
MSKRVISVEQMHEEPGKFYLGTELLNYQNKVEFNIDALDNGHIIIVGPTGSGKSRILEQILKYFVRTGRTIHFPDFQGTFHLEDENLIEYPLLNATAGINPFAFIPDQKRGGISSRIVEILDMLGQTHIKSMGAIQKAVLRQVIVDNYRVAGFDPEDPTTWGCDVDMSNRDQRKAWNDRLPSFASLKALIDDILNIAQSGFSPDFMKSIRSNANQLHTWSNDLKRLKKEISKLLDSKTDSNASRVDNEINARESTIAGIEEAILESEGMLKENFWQYMKFTYLDEESSEFDHLVGEEKLSIDYNFYMKPKILKTLETLSTYIDDINFSDIFHKNMPHVKRGFNNHNVSAHTDENLILFTHVLSDQLLRSVKIRGEYRQKSPEYRAKYGELFDTVLVIDEAKLVMPDGTMRESARASMNRTVSEGRKYGYALVVISQQLQDFPKTFFGNVATKISVGAVPEDIDRIKKVFGATKEQVAQHMIKGVSLIHTTAKEPYTVAHPWAEI